jgi:hypothetical protein
VESLWGTAATAFFRAPAEAKVRVRYALGAERQLQTLDGDRYSKVEVGAAASLLHARIEVWTPRDCTMTYDIYPGPAFVRAPAIAF